MNRATYNAGFSLVEIMVGMVIGLLGVIIIMQIFAVAEGQKRTTTSGADAQTNGNIALFTIERDARQAGYGMDLTGLGCVINTSYLGSITNPGTLTLAPVLIVDGGTDGSGNALPDQLRLFYSTNTINGMPELLNALHGQTANTATIASNLTVADNDMVVFYEAGKNCALAQVTSVAGNDTDFNHNPSSDWNNTAIFPGTGYNANATVYNFGAMTHRNYSIDAANNNLQVFDVSSGGLSTLPIAGEIVNLQAQYGKDTTPTPDGIVDIWDNNTPVTNDDWKRVLAVRIAILARSGQYEKPTTGGVCTATTAAPSWTGGTMAV
ncbi:MAG: PilW family protein, partial [Burkholderiales bacterium]